MAANAIAGGISARIQGADFVTGFERSFVTGAAQWSYTSNVGYSPNALPGWNQPDGVSQNYDYNSLGQQYSDSWGENVIGFNQGLTGNSWSDLGTQGGIVSRILNYVPGINATAGFHDWIFNSGTFDQTTFANIATMLPAAALSYAALINGPLTVQLTNKH